MLNKILLVGAMGLVASSVVLADGAYLGAGVGSSALFTKNTNTGTITASNDSLVVTGDSTDDNGNIGFNGTVLGGYRWSLPHQFVLGVEAFDNVSSAKAAANNNTATSVELPNDFGIDIGVDDITSNSTTDTKINNVYGLRFLPGYQISQDVEVHAILGYARAHAQVNTSTSFSSNDLEIGTGSGSTESSANFNGYQLGMGSIAQLTEHLSLRGDIIYTGYRSQTVNDSFSTGAGTATGSVDLTMSTLEGNVDLVYSFS
ncbi:MAG: hypothetical protein V4496_07795 [Pseudomonadota bacterium]